MDWVQLQLHALVLGLGRRLSIDILTKMMLSCHKSPLELIIHTSASILSAVEITKYDFVVLLVDGSKAECLDSLRDAVSKLDIGYFSRKCCTVSVTASVTQGVQRNYREIQKVLYLFPLASTMPIWNCNFEEEKDVEVLACRILNSMSLCWHHMGVLVGEVTGRT
ncbi:uncharacterized protein LOC134184982 [Corticium candelabrum]|uniref:uncharacterized protein LOC134184982 n=1 Tax=Corticium candelabrum TaxID=121492 RepID=UPI002E344897|nr:uncharacterized protein LOC134184982 [Corticium candelabrum]